jgi:uncharacterized protein (TIGR03437 family)
MRRRTISQDSLVIAVLCAVGSAGVAGAQTIQLDPASIANAGSYIPPGYPNGGIPHGGMFVVKGAGGSAPLGSCGVKVVGQFPIATNLNGTSMSVSVGGTSYDVPMVYVVACSGTDQLAGILPSNVPTGAGTLTVTYNGSMGSAPVTVVDRSPGLFTLNQGGTGAAVIQNYVSDTVLTVNTLATPAKPGQIAIAWGTGLGPDGNSDADAPKPTDLGIPLEFYVGGKPATLTYRGRSGCCAGIDQIVFTVPDGVGGCFVPVFAKIGNSVSNFTTMSISADGSPCSDGNGLTAADIQKAQSTNKIRLGLIDLVRSDGEIVTGSNAGSVTRSDEAVAAFADLSFSALQGLPVREISSPGSCMVWRGNTTGLVLDRPPLLTTYTNLDAGMITVSGAAGSAAMNYRGNFYDLSLGTAGYQEPAGGPGPSSAFLEPGAFTLTSAGGGPVPGGANIGAINSQISVAAPPTFNNRFSVADVQRSQGVTVNWSGVDPAATVEIRGFSALNQPGAPGAAFFCIANAGAGQFTVPPGVLLSLPASTSDPTAPGSSAFNLAVGVTGSTRFTAAGVDVGILRFSSLFGRNASFH